MSDKYIAQIRKTYLEEEAIWAWEWRVINSVGETLNEGAVHYRPLMIMSARLRAADEAKTALKHLMNKDKPEGEWETLSEDGE